MKTLKRKALAEIEGELDTMHMLLNEYTKSCNNHKAIARILLSVEGAQDWIYAIKEDEDES